MMTISWMRLLPALLFSLLVGVPAYAQVEEEEEDHFDIYLARPETGTQTVYGGIDVDHGEIDLGLRVFESELEQDAFGAFMTSAEPGFNNPGSGPMASPQASGANALNPGDMISVAAVPITLGGVTGDLFYWDGVGEPSFSLVDPTDVGFTIGDPEDEVTSLPAQADANGAFDNHPELLLNELDSTDAVFSPGGIYLASFTASVTGLDPTDPLFLVLVTDESFEPGVEPAIDFVASNLVVPEPAAALLAGLAIFAAGVRRCV